MPIARDLEAKTPCPKPINENKFESFLVPSRKLN